jgi:hypothetical protein
MFGFKKKLRKSISHNTKSKSVIHRIQSISPDLNNKMIHSKNKQTPNDEIKKTADIIHDDVASAVATLRLWLNQDKLH